MRQLSINSTGDSDFIYRHTVGSSHCIPANNYQSRVNTAALALVKESNPNDHSTDDVRYKKPLYN